MKYAVLIGDGMADYPVSELDDRTPLEVARIPVMDGIAHRGQVGLARTIPHGFAPGSDIGNLSVLGYDPREYFTGRAPLEAVNLGIDIAEDEVAFRCNMVTVTDGLMDDFSAGHISTEEADKLIAALNDHFRGTVRFHTGTNYRHIAVFESAAVGDEMVARLADVACTPPHDITGEPIGPHLPTGPGSELLDEVMQRAVPVVSAHPVATARRAAGKKPVTGIWLWGQGRAPNMPQFIDQYGLTGAVISAVDLVKGIGKCVGLEPVIVPGATGYFDTNYVGKAESALDALDRHDLVYVHVEAPDEAGHEGLVEEKVHSIEQFDKLVVGTVVEGIGRFDAYRVLVTCDHATSLKKRTHVSDMVPFAFMGTGVAPNGAHAFHETAGAATGLRFENGYELMGTFTGSRAG